MHRLEEILRELAGAFQVHSQFHTGVPIDHFPQLYSELATIHQSQRAEALALVEQLRPQLSESEYPQLYSDLRGILIKVSRTLEPVADGSWAKHFPFMTGKSLANAMLVPYEDARRLYSEKLVGLAEKVLGTDLAEITETKSRKTRRTKATLEQISATYERIKATDAGKSMKANNVYEKGATDLGISKRTFQEGVLKNNTRRPRTTSKGVEFDPGMRVKPKRRN